MTVATFTATAAWYAQYADSSNPPTTFDAQTGFDSPNRVTTNKGKFGATYANGVILLQFDTSSLPDDANIESAELSFVPKLLESADGAKLIGEYFDWGGGTPDSSDWTSSPGTDAMTATTYTGMTLNTRGSLALTGLAGINKTGNTRMRFGLDLTMSGSLTTNRLQPESTGGNPIQLIVTYDTATPIAATMNTPVSLTMAPLIARDRVRAMPLAVSLTMNGSYALGSASTGGGAMSALSALTGAQQL